MKTKHLYFDPQSGVIYSLVFTEPTIEDDMGEVSSSTAGMLHISPANSYEGIELSLVKVGERFDDED